MHSSTIRLGPCIAAILSGLAWVGIAIAAHDPPLVVAGAVVALAGVVGVVLVGRG